jgi:hypothetical protein
MCNEVFACSRPDGKTNTTACRLALMRWRKVYGADPVNPPGKGNIHAPYWNREAFLRAYVNVPAYEKHKKQLKKKPA